MGEVYRARDTRLHREVAIKVLPDAFSQDRDRLLRFEREARLLAALNHPNIASIYGLEEQDGARLLVLELVEGLTLAEKLASGPLPIDEVLSVGAGVASGLEAAHEAGIIHRDLKPSNVKVRTDGAVKVLDLGLARVAETSSVAVDSSLSPTVTTPATHAGVVLGTAAYMSPEQARGKPLDKRSDIFSFGCVLYECLTGRQAFSGETVSDTLSAILRAEPDWSALPAATPARIRDLLRRCLQKDPKRRLHDIADARIELEESQTGAASGETAPPREAPGRRGRIAWVAAGAVLGAAIAAAAFVVLSRPSKTEPRAVRAVLPFLAGDRPSARYTPNVAVSPDGQTVVFRAVHEGQGMLFRRVLDGNRPEPIAGTQGGIAPFFSPDGQWIGFFTTYQLKKVPLSGGTAVVLSKIPPISCGGSWGEDGRIVVSPTFNGALSAVSEGGGDIQPLTRLDRTRGEHAHLYPEHLPGRHGILFTLRRGSDFADTSASSIAVLDSPTGKWKTVLEGASFARYGGGRLVFVRGGSVFSAPFDVERLSVTGPVTPFPGEVALDLPHGFGQFDLSSDGTLAFLDGPPVSQATTAILRIDRNGQETTMPLPSGSYSMPRLSPDGRRLAVSRWTGIKGSVAIYDRDRQNLSTLTPEPGSHFGSVWSPDGRRVAFSRFGMTNPALSVKNADGSGTIETLTEPSINAEFPNSWSPDGKTLLYTRAYGSDPDPGRRLLTTDLWIVTPGDPKSARAWFETPFGETAGMFSPDGQWVAYVSDENETQEVYVRPFPGPGAAVKISNGFAIEPQWSRDGHVLYYRSGEDAEKFYAVEFRPGSSVATSAPRLVMSSSGLDVGGREDDYCTYDVAPDGREFVALRSVRPPEPERRLTIMTGWPAAPGR